MRLSLRKVAWSSREAANYIIQQAGPSANLDSSDSRLLRRKAAQANLVQIPNSAPNQSLISKGPHRIYVRSSSRGNQTGCDRNYQQ